MAFINHSKSFTKPLCLLRCQAERNGQQSTSIAAPGCKLPLFLFLMEGGEERSSLPITRVLFPSDISSQAGLSLPVWHSRLSPRNLESYSSFQSLLIPWYLESKPCLYLPFASAVVTCVRHQWLVYALWPVHCPAKSRSLEVALRKSAILLFLSFFKLQVKNHLWLFFFFLCECNHITSSSCFILFFCVVHSDTFLQYFFCFVLFLIHCYIYQP